MGIPANRGRFGHPRPFSKPRKALWFCATAAAGWALAAGGALAQQAADQAQPVGAVVSGDGAAQSATTSSPPPAIH